MRIASVFLSLTACLFLAAQLPQNTGEGPRLLLSEYAFFEGELAALKPAKGVFAYQVNAPLFSDYAEKARFIYLPEGKKMQFRDTLSFEFPDGAVIIKNFYYFNDARKPESGRKILETRLLVRQAAAWKALDYIWDEDQKEARLEVAGAEIPVEWTDHNGKKQKVNFAAPNLNQCKGCHTYDGQFMPIGITARQLNGTFEGQNQLAQWREKGLLEGATGKDFSGIATLVNYLEIPRENGTGNPYNAAARSYLDANCGHCHNPHGPASTSGMFLHYYETQSERLGIGKAPVAAGRGSGDRKYGIVPGKPGESILLYRMEQNDPGIRMPELGRQLAHVEGIALIRQWIKNM